MDHIKDKTIIVTGGFGFVGQQVIEKLLKFNVKRIIILDSLDYGSENKNFNNFLILLTISIIMYHFILFDNNIYCILWRNLKKIKILILKE